MSEPKKVILTNGKEKKTFPSVAEAVMFLYGNPKRASDLRRAVREGWRVRGWDVSFEGVSEGANEGVKIDEETRSHIFAILKKHPELVSEFEGKREILAPAPAISEQLDYIRDIKSRNGNVLAFSCMHYPFQIHGAEEFLAETYHKYNCSDIVCLGDLVDNSATNRHGADPDGLSAGIEFQVAYDGIKKLVEYFPNMYLTPGNHDARPSKMGRTVNISNRWIKSLKEAFDFPNTWKIAYKIEIDGVLYSHGDTVGGLYPAANLALKNRQSTVAGHAHSVGMVYHLESHRDGIFGMNVACLVDIEKYAFAYAKDQPKRPVIACGVVLDGGKQAFVIKK